VDHVLGLACTICGRLYQPDPGRYVCDIDGEAGTLDVIYDYDRIRGRIHLYQDDPTMWRYRPLLPIGDGAELPPLQVGGTPLVPARRVAAELGLGTLWIKDDSRQPTASLKDRASAVAVIKAREQGAEVITTASTGNAAAALAGMCASLGQRNVIFVPSTAPEAKVAQLLAYGATVALVEGTYTDAVDLCMAAAAHYGWYNRTTGYNPYVGEGKKTVVLEILDQIGGMTPDAIFVPVGDGSIIGGVHKGLRDAIALGWIAQMPRLYGVQAAGSDYLVQAFEGMEDVTRKPPIRAQTVADSISADLPRDRVKALAAVRDTAGSYLRVDDDDILRAIPTLAASTGVFAEPAAAAAFAGLVAAIEGGMIARGETAVVICTGSGLKDVRSAIRGVEVTGGRAIRIAPTLAELDTALGRK
jgi:threonine synthase